jgi:uncharacterized protein (TIGR02145 family)
MYRKKQVISRQEMKSAKIIKFLCFSIIGISLDCCKPEEIILHGEINGTVTDAATNQSLQSVTVKLESINDSTNTGSDGKYLFKNLIPGSYEIKASKFPYGTTTKTAEIIPAKIQELNFALNAVPVPDFSEKYLDFGLDSTSLVFIISNKGVGEMAYVISTSQDWITVNPSMGTVTDEADSITVTINKTGLSDNRYNEKIKIISIVGEEVAQNTVEVYLNGVMDIDVNYYPVVRIGTQVWMAENLRTGVRKDPIIDNQTDNGIIEIYCSFGSCDTRYGGHYLWDEMMQYNPPDNRIIGETQGVCPVGWHIPTEKEWVTLIDYLGGPAVAGGKLKIVPINFWDLKPNIGATDETGFSAPGAEFDIRKVFKTGFAGSCAAFWTSSECDPKRWCRYYLELRRGDAEAHILPVPEDYNKDYAYSVRCVKNPPKK